MMHPSFYFTGGRRQPERGEGVCSGWQQVEPPKPEWRQPRILSSGSFNCPWPPSVTPYPEEQGQLLKLRATLWRVCLQQQESYHLNSRSSKQGLGPKAACLANRKGSRQVWRDGQLSAHSQAPEREVRMLWSVLPNGADFPFWIKPTTRSSCLLAPFLAHREAQEMMRRMNETSRQSLHVLSLRTGKKKKAQS